MIVPFMRSPADGARGLVALHQLRTEGYAVRSNQDQSTVQTRASREPRKTLVAIHRFVIWIRCPNKANRDTSWRIDNTQSLSREGEGGLEVGDKRREPCGALCQTSEGRLIKATWGLVSLLGISAVKRLNALTQTLSNRASESIKGWPGKKNKWDPAASSRFR